MFFVREAKSFSGLFQAEETKEEKKEELTSTELVICEYYIFEYFMEEITDCFKKKNAEVNKKLQNGLFLTDFLRILEKYKNSKQSILKKLGHTSNKVEKIKYRHLDDVVKDVLTTPVLSAEEKNKLSTQEKNKLVEHIDFIKKIFSHKEIVKASGPRPSLLTYIQIYLSEDITHEELFSSFNKKQLNRIKPKGPLFNFNQLLLNSSITNEERRIVLEIHDIYLNKLANSLEFLLNSGIESVSAFKKAIDSGLFYTFKTKLIKNLNCILQNPYCQELTNTTLMEKTSLQRMQEIVKFLDLLFPGTVVEVEKKLDIKLYSSGTYITSCPPHLGFPPECVLTTKNPSFLTLDILEALGKSSARCIELAKTSPAEATLALKEHHALMCRLDVRMRGFTPLEKKEAADAEARAEAKAKADLIRAREKDREVVTARKEAELNKAICLEEKKPIYPTFTYTQQKAFNLEKFSDACFQVQCHSHYGIPADKRIYLNHDAISFPELENIVLAYRDFFTPKRDGRRAATTFLELKKKFNVAIISEKNIAFFNKPLKIETTEFRGKTMFTVACPVSFGFGPHQALMTDDKEKLIIEVLEVLGAVIANTATEGFRKFHDLTHYLGVDVIQKAVVAVPLSIEKTKTEVEGKAYAEADFTATVEHSAKHRALITKTMQVNVPGEYYQHQLRETVQMEAEEKVTVSFTHHARASAITSAKTAVEAKEQALIQAKAEALAEAKTIATEKAHLMAKKSAEEKAKISATEKANVLAEERLKKSAQALLTAVQTRIEQQRVAAAVATQAQTNQKYIETLYKDWKTKEEASEAYRSDGRNFMSYEGGTEMQRLTSIEIAARDKYQSESTRLNIKAKAETKVRYAVAVAY